MVVKTFNLIVSLDRTICFEFDFKNPYTTNNIFFKGKGFKRPSGISLKGMKINRYGLKPMRMADGMRIK